jgi:hypothetical protein
MPTGFSRIRRLGWLQWLIFLVLLSFGVIMLLIAGDHPSGAGKSVLREIGIVTIGTVLVSLVYEFVLRPEHDRQLLSVVESSLITKAPDYGLACVDALDFREPFAQLEANDELCWLDTYCPDMGRGVVQEALRNALQRGATLRMLVIDPGSFVAYARAEEIATRGYTPDVFEEGARASLRVIQDIRDELPDDQASRLIIRIYTDLPCAPIYLRLASGQPVAGWTSYFLGLPTYEAAHFYWSRAETTSKPIAPGLGLHAFHEYFEAKWQRSRSLT